MNASIYANFGDIISKMSSQKFVVRIYRGELEDMVFVTPNVSRVKEIISEIFREENPKIYLRENVLELKSEHIKALVEILR